MYPFSSECVVVAGSGCFDAIAAVVLSNARGMVSESERQLGSYFRASRTTLLVGPHGVME